MSGGIYRAPGRVDGDRNLLICAGLDPSGGAGVIADVRVATALGIRPVAIVTALTVQDTTGVRDHHALDADVIREQLEVLLSDVEVHAVKIGMIGSTEIALAMAKALELTGAPVVWDPVTHPSNGAPWYMDKLFGEAVAALAPHVTLLTPNAKELAWMTEREIGSFDDAIEAGAALAARHGVAVLVKGGHLARRPDDKESVDVLIDGALREHLVGPRIPRGEHVHGTGCALSTAIAAELAKGEPLLAACRVAKSFVADRIANPVRPGRGVPAVV